MDKKTSGLVKKFAKKVKKNYPNSKIILFGSRARGDSFEKSDFDFVIIDKSFEGVPFFERISLFYDFWDAPYDLEVFCYTPEEFSRMILRRGTIQTANKEGIIL